MRASKGRGLAVAGVLMPSGFYHHSAMAADFLTFRILPYFEGVGQKNAEDMLA
jgi:hypothetical protein